MKFKVGLRFKGEVWGLAAREPKTIYVGGVGGALSKCNLAGRLGYRRD